MVLHILHYMDDKVVYLAHLAYPKRPFSYAIWAFFWNLPLPLRRMGEELRMIKRLIAFVAIGLLTN